MKEEELAGVPPEESQVMIEQRMVDLQIEEILARREVLQQRIFDLENRLAGRLEELRTWEEILDEELGLR